MLRTLMALGLALTPAVSLAQTKTSALPPARATDMGQPTLLIPPSSISIGYVLAANSAASTATTNASCAPGAGHSLIVTDSGGAINVYEDGATTSAAVTMTGGAARPTVTSSTLTGGINIGGSSTSSAFVGLFYIGSEILVSAGNMTLAERNFEFGRLNAARQ